MTTRKKANRSNGHKRNANGQGSDFQRSDGRWVAVLPPDPRTGKRLRFTAKTQGEALKKRDAARLRLEVFGELATADPTLESYLRQWLSHAVRVRRTTKDSYTLNVEKRIIPAIGKLRLSRIRPIDVRRMMDAIAARTSASTANQARRVLRAALNDARQDRIVIGDNAAALADPLPEKRFEGATLDAGQVGQLLASLADPLRALVAFAAATGMRQGEALGLRWSDVAVDGDDPGVRLRLQLQRIDGVFCLVDLKTKNSHRSLPLSPNLVALLRAHRAKQSARQLALGPLWQNRLGLVFVADDGAPLCRHRVTFLFQSALAKVGLPKIRFHDLRVTAGTITLERNGGDLKAVSMMLGHSTITLTANTYAHVSQRTMARTMGLLDDLAR